MAGRFQLRRKCLVISYLRNISWKKLSLLMLASFTFKTRRRTNTSHKNLNRQLSMSSSTFWTISECCSRNPFSQVKSVKTLNNCISWLAIKWFLDIFFVTNNSSLYWIYPYQTTTRRPKYTCRVILSPYHPPSSGNTCSQNSMQNLNVKIHGNIANTDP